VRQEAQMLRDARFWRAKCRRARFQPVVSDYPDSICGSCDYLYPDESSCALQTFTSFIQG
jgi:hypothetical protein